MEGVIMEITRTHSREATKVNMPVKGVEQKRQKQNDRRKNASTNTQNNNSESRRIDYYA